MKSGSQGRLVVFDREQVIASALQDNGPGGFILGVKRVETHPASHDIDALQERSHRWDFIALLLDELAAEVMLPARAGCGDQLRATAGAGMLAVNGNDFLAWHRASHLFLKRKDG